MTDLTNSLLEQHLAWVRHNENERWWVMGAWLTATGYLGIKILSNSEFERHIFTVSILHLIFSFLVLMMLLKHTLEVKRLLEYADMIVRNEEDKEKYRIKSLREIVREGKAKDDARNWKIIQDCLKRIFTLWTFISFTNAFIILLAFGMYLDVRFIFFKGITIISFKFWNTYTFIFAALIWISAHFFIRWFEKRIESYYKEITTN